MKNFLLLAFALSVGLSSFAANLKIEAVEWYHEEGPPLVSKVKLTIGWDAAWRNGRNHDAAWVVLKFQRWEWGASHALLASSGHRMIANHVDGSPAPEITVPADQTGFFISPKETFRGTVKWTIELVLDQVVFESDRFYAREHFLKALGVEMVYVPSGSFFLGDPDTTLLPSASLFRSAGEGQFGGLFKVESETEPIAIGPEEGKLFYQVKRAIYQGDQTGKIPASFPKGVQAFYAMKYELRQGEYAFFLQTLSDNQSQQRANFGGRNYYSIRGTIRFEDGRYFAASPQRHCNYLSWDDAMAWADWAALRPMTELEFTKACRGARQPDFHERPWGSESRERLSRYVNEAGDMVMLGDLDEAMLNDGNREVFGASEFWVMDLAGSLWERVITIGDEKGRAFQGVHGDGAISQFGFANVEDWPEGIEEEGGYGFRGGGFYVHERSAYDLNPHAPVANRKYGAWSGGNRTEAYGSRFVRTAE